MKWKVVFASMLILFLIGILPNTSKVACADQSDDFLVGAAYMTFWGTGVDIDWHSDAVYLPTLGNYSSSDTTIANQHIEWALNHSIDFFFLDYGWATDEDRNKTENAAIEGLLAAESMNRKDFNFSIFYFPDRVLDPGFVNKSHLEEDFSHINKTYFDRSNYLRLDGRFVVILADFPKYLDTQNSTEDINNLFHSLKEEYSLYLIPAFWPCPTYDVYSVLDDYRRVYDAITLWGQNTILEFNQSISYSAYVNKTKLNFVMWSSVAENFEVGFVPLVCPGYDNNIFYNWTPPKHDFWAIVNRDPNGFGNACRLAGEYATEPHNMVLLFTWNDFKEGTSIEPTTDYNSTYLEIVRDYIPEFPSFLILPLFMITTLLAVIVLRLLNTISSTKERVES